MNCGFAVVYGMLLEHMCLVFGLYDSRGREIVLDLRRHEVALPGKIHM